MASLSLRSSCGEKGTESLFIIQGFAQAHQALSLGSSPSLQPFIIGLSLAEREERDVGPSTGEALMKALVLLSYKKPQRY